MRILYIVLVVLASSIITSTAATHLDVQRSQNMVRSDSDDDSNTSEDRGNIVTSARRVRLPDVFPTEAREMMAFFKAWKSMTAEEIMATPALLKLQDKEHLKALEWWGLYNFLGEEGLLIFYELKVAEAKGEEALVREFGKKLAEILKRQWYKIGKQPQIHITS